MIRIVTIVLVILTCLFGIFYFLSNKQSNISKKKASEVIEKITDPYAAFPLSIKFQREKKYPGSKFVIEQTLAPGVGYKQYIASYLSDGLKIYGLLSIPTSQKPASGYPAIIFNHGYIPPEEYRTTERYVAYFANLASEGYVVFKPDYRGHGSSEGQPEGAYFSPGYLTDVLNALSSVRQMDEVNKERVGMWGHSLGGFLTLRAMVIQKDIKVGVIWGGVVGSYQDMADDWWSKRRVGSFTPSSREQQSNRPGRDSFTKKYGQPNDNDPFWRAISTTTFLDDISGPLQLDHGGSDETVPVVLSQKLYKKLLEKGKVVEYYEYPGSDHNISQGYNLAMQRTKEFFAKYLK